jgi:hypothetical protein
VETVYNVEVEEDHTYFVGELGWGFAVWAHNAPYDVGKAKDLRKLSGAGNQVHHAPGARSAESLIGDFKRANKVGNEAAIELPRLEHEAVTEAQRTMGASASARDLLAQEIRALRNNTEAPNSALKKLIQLSKDLHFWDYRKL